MAATRLAIGWLCLLLLAQCKRQPDVSDAPAAPPSPPDSAVLPAEPSTARPRASAVVEAAKSIQASKLKVAPERTRERRLAFGKGVLGQLTTDELRVFDTHGFERIASAPLPGARLLLTLADGSLLAVGAETALAFDPTTKKFKSLGKPVLLPGDELLADAIRPERAWAFARRRTGETVRQTLSSLVLGEGSGRLLLPESTLELEGEPGGVLGNTREGVWLYFGSRRAERFGPGGQRLAGLALPELPKLLWALPARRLDQCYLLDAAGHVTRALVTPTFKKLGETALAGDPFTADVGDEGRLLAVVVVAGAGPSFELRLYDAELAELGHAALPSDAPTGADDWVSVVTRNQTVAVSAYEPRAAVGGPDRARIFDARAAEIFSIPSR